MRFPRPFALTLATLAAAGCAGGDLVLPSGVDGPSAGRSALSAAPASIEAGSATSAIAVTVRDGDGNPVEGATVTLQATGGGNTLTQPSGPTGPNGLATGTFRSSEPGMKTISATVNGSVQVSETAAVTVTSAPVTSVEPIEGDNQIGPAGTALPLRPAVRVIDDQGQPVAGAGVAFVVTGGGGSVNGDLQTTNAEGIARSGGWTLGASPGTNTLEARAGSAQGSPVVFHAEGVASGGSVDHFVFRVQPPDAGEDEFFTVEVAMVDDDGEVVPLSGIEIYLGLFRDGEDEPSNDRLQGDRFQDTEDGIAVFTVAVSREGRYRLRALSDELPALGPHGPEPYLFSDPFDVD